MTITGDTSGKILGCQFMDRITGYDTRGVISYMAITGGTSRMMAGMSVYG